MQNTSTQGNSTIYSQIVTGFLNYGHTKY